MEMPPSVYEAINEMFQCNSFVEHLACFKQFYEELKDCLFIVFSEHSTCSLPEPLKTNYENNFAIINIGSSNQFYAVNDKIYQEMIYQGKSNYTIDTCIDLDTQAVSYLRKCFKDYDQKPDISKLNDLLEFLSSPNLDYSCHPYLIENATKNFNKIDCYSNINSFVLFKNFEYDKFIRYGICEYRANKETMILDTDCIYKYIYSQIFTEEFKDIYRVQRAIYIILSKAICIEFNNSKKSAKNKMMELLDFINTQLGFVAERELNVCYYYFLHHESTKKFFKNIQRNACNMSKTINGMSLDLAHIRFLEQECTYIPDKKSVFSIHVLLTYDNGLKEILKINPIEQIAIYNGVSVVKFKHQLIDYVPEAEEKLLSEANMLHRKEIFNKLDIDALYISMKQEIDNVCRL